MIFQKEEDWKNFLSDEAKEILAKLLDSTKKHRAAYLQAEDVKVAQLWCAIVELQKQFSQLTEVIKKIEEPFKAIVAIGEAEKRKTIERLVTEIIKPEEEAEKEATQKLVDSLMKF
ncbi:MAG: hypothetical protein NZ942_02245 [Candidatus Aenigmarchaeota archaeon]|nr:hypothetical protein [Candidatus Aenigmarchaeota archaeon]